MRCHHEQKHHGHGAQRGEQAAEEQGHSHSLKGVKKVKNDQCAGVRSVDDSLST